MVDDCRSVLPCSHTTLPAPGFPHVAVLFDADGEVIAVRPVEPIGAGEEALVSLVSEFTNEQRATA